MRPDTVLAHVAAREQILAKLRHVLITRLKLRRELDELDPDAPLFGSGFGLDSLDAVELVVCMDNQLGVRIADGGLLRQQMRSLNTLVDLVLATQEANRVAH
ncbi:MAG TPA: phosphopantetheine-binding protein [Kofleriaceae bacterium]|jgi:acyl carrier protein|nr:phosphopantetheine-binding protein [Kofleriaceae bacterium]